MPSDRAISPSPPAGGSEIGARTSPVRRRRSPPSRNALVAGRFTTTRWPVHPNRRNHKMNQFRDVFDRQKEYFATGVTRSHDWRVDQIDRVRQMVAENEAALQAAMAADF
jgi:hypothetical protein